MRSKPVLVIPIAIGITIFLSACKKNAVELEYTNAKGEVPQMGNLVFRFNKSLIKDSLLNAWDSTDYISFTPKIPGRFRWESPDQLVFSPSQPLLPATTYSAKFGNELFRYSKYNKVEGADKVSFNTPALALENAQVVWTMPDEATRNVIPQLDLFFNYKIDPATLKEKLTIHVDGKETSFTPQTVSPDSKISFRLASFKPEDRNYETKITIDKGLKPEGGTNSIVESITENLSIPSPYVLTIQNVESEHDGTEGTIRITTNQQLVETDLKSYISFEPAIQYVTEMDESGLTLRSDKFDIEKSYTVTFKEGMRGKIGGELKEESQHQVAFGELEAGISFTTRKAVYLSKRGAKNMEVKITNIPKVKLTISKIYESNLLMVDRYGYYPQPTSASYRSYDDEGEYYNEYGGSDATLGDIIYEKEIDTRSLPKSGGGKILNVSQFEDRLPEFKGIYHVQISSMKDYWIKDSRYISVSDIGLVAKEGVDKIVVFTNSIKTAEGMNGVDVSVYSKNNQLIGTGSTNNDGVAEIAYTRKDFRGFQPALIIAKTADDFNYLPFSSTRVNTSRFDVGGKRNNPSGLDAFVYAERDIYRPGEKINFSVIIRNREWRSPGEIPVKMKFLLPNGKELKAFRKTLSEEGSAEGNIEMALSAITGSYTLEVYTSNDLLLASKDFRIEEFVPDRIRVNAKLDKTFLKADESTTLAINAMNFFGPPAANRKYETEIQTKHKYFSPEKFADFNFSFTNQNTSISKEVREGSTDAEGNAKQVFTVSDDLRNKGVLQTTFYTTVFDETGRPVSRATSIDVFTQDVFFGIKYDGWYYHALNQPVQFILASVNKDGNAVNAKAKIEIIKREYNTHLVNTGGYFRYESSEEVKNIETRELTIGAASSYRFVPRIPGRYELRVYVPGSTNYVSQSFYSYGRWGWSDNNSFEVSNEGNVEIDIDKKSYLAGETVSAHFKPPFSGRMLVTMETDKVVSHQYVNVDVNDKNRTVKVDLPLTSEHVPNVYITATLIKAHEISDLPLTVAHGFKNIKVEEKNRKMEVSINASKTVRSKTKQKVTVKAAPGSYVTLSAVDNGVLQVSNFETPDPYDFFYQKKALQVSAFDLYPLLFPELRAKFSSTGGDGEMDMSKRVNPMPAKRIKVVSYWSGIRQANGNGEASFEFSVPQFSGEIRLMAVAYKNQSFGSSEKTMTVADPIVISTALPRFLSPGDTVTVPVTLSNTTARSANIAAAISVEGPLKIIGESNQSATINANSEGRAVFQVAADPSVAVGKIKIAVNGMGEKFTDETEISVRPASPLQKVSSSGSIVGGTTQKINIGVSDPIAIGFIPSSVAYKLVVSRSPALELGEHLRYLVEYPYGCTEQTISAAFPQLYYGDMSDLMGLNQKLKANANTNILEAIRKIKMRQTYKGGLMLWDNDDTEHWWATVYAAHFLLEAKKAGFDVDNSLIETTLGYINGRLKTRETINYYYNREQNKKIAPKEVAYSLYVLALAGKSNVSAMNYYKANQQLLALDSRYLLSAAYAAAGDKKSFNSLLPSAFAGEESVPQTGGSFYSDVRDEAIALNALIDADPGNSQIGIMAKHVSDKLKNRNWLSTQERSFSFLALGKLAKAAVKSDVTADIKVNGKTVAKVDGGQWTGTQSALQGTNIDIETKGSGRLYYFWVAEGISTSGAYKEEDNYLRVRKRFYDRNGRPLTGNTFKQNDLIIVGITLERSYSTDIENVVITDLLPAGFEIENPRTKEIPGMDWIKDASDVRSLDVRDDRIHFFVDADRAKKNFYYAVRAVSPGIYKLGPVGADAMYNGEYHSYHGAGVIRVVQ